MSRDLSTIVIVAGLSPFVLLSGCAPQQPSDKDALLFYLRSASVDGRVRRLWPAGQTYVDAVLKARAAYHKKLAAITEAGSLESLWDGGDPRWRQIDALDRRAETLDRALSVDVAEARLALNDLRKAIEQVPEDLKLDGNSKNAFVDEVWTAMRADGADVIERLAHEQKLLEEHRTLYKRAREAADADRDNLANGEARFTAAHAALHRKLANARDALLDEAQREIEVSGKRLTQIEKHTREGLYLEDRMRFFRNRSRAILQAAMDALNKVDARSPANGAGAAHKESGKDSSSSAETPDFKRHLADRLAEDVAHLQKRVDAIEQTWQAAKSDSSGADR